MSADLFVADTDEVDLPVVVLCLHSLFIDHTMFDELVAAAAGRFRMMRPDFRGQGANPDATELVTMDQCAADILDLLGRVRGPSAPPRIPSELGIYVGQAGIEPATERL